METKISNFVDVSCSKRLHMCNWDTILESHGRLDKTVYGESSAKVSREHQQWVFFEFFMLFMTCISSSENASYKNL